MQKYLTFISQVELPVLSSKVGISGEVRVPNWETTTTANGVTITRTDSGVFLAYPIPNKPQGWTK